MWSSRTGLELDTLRTNFGGLGLNRGLCLEDAVLEHVLAYSMTRGCLLSHTAAAAAAPLHRCQIVLFGEPFCP